MNAQQFVDWIREYLRDKKKLKKNEVNEIKNWLSHTINENANDVIFRNWDIVGGPPTLDMGVDIVPISTDYRPFPRIHNG